MSLELKFNRAKQGLKSFFRSELGILLVVAVIACLVFFGLIYGIVYATAVTTCNRLSALNHWATQVQGATCYVQLDDYWIPSDQIGYYLGR